MPTPFAGFQQGKTHLIPIPAPFFTDLLPKIEHLGELKVTLYAFWFLDQQEGSVRYMTFNDLASDHILSQTLGDTPEAAGKALTEALECAIRTGTLLYILPEGALPEKACYFLNSPRGRAAAQAMANGDWLPGEENRMAIKLEAEQRNIYRLYEENIGPLTPMVADTLREAEQLYSSDWIEDAIRIAVENNVRRWRYIEVILNTWKEKGRNEPYSRDTEEDRFRYIKGKYADFGEH